MFYIKDGEYFSFAEVVTFPDGTVLTLESKDLHTYPVNGYYYFETLEEAKNFFGIIE